MIAAITIQNIQRTHIRYQMFLCIGGKDIGNAWIKAGSHNAIKPCGWQIFPDRPIASYIQILLLQAAHNLLYPDNLHLP